MVNFQNKIKKVSSNLFIVENFKVNLSVKFTVAPIPSPTPLHKSVCVYIYIYVNLIISIYISRHLYLLKYYRRLEKVGSDIESWGMIRCCVKKWKERKWVAMQ